MYHYYYADKNDQIKPKDLPFYVNELVVNARKNQAKQVPPPIGQAWEFLVWFRKSYIVFVVDDPDVTFDPDKPIEFALYPGTDNYSFSGIATFPVPDETGSKRVWAVHAKNRMKTKSGKDIGKASERYVITLNTDPLITIERREGPKPDDGGNNMGPPVPPP